MNTQPTTWTRLDLELYHDEALDASIADRLSEALRESPDLRRRLADVARADALARAALSRPTSTRSPFPPRWAALLSAVAALSLVAGAALIFRSTSVPQPTQPVVHATDATPHDSMIVFSFPIPKQQPRDTASAAPDASAPRDAVVAVPPEPPPPDATAKPPTDPARFVASLDAALARGDAPAAAQLLATSDDKLRVHAYRRLGVVLRSVTTAREVLSELPVDAQLAACRELALEPRWRTVTCAQLTVLREDEASREAVDALLTELARSPELAPLVQRVRSSGGRTPAKHSDRSI